MAYSTIERKKCKCGCNKYPTMSCFGYNYNCLPQELKEKAGTKKKVQIKNKNARVSAAYKIRKEQRKTDGTEERELWFIMKKHEMTGTCAEPGCKESTNKYHSVYYRWSICHIAPKAYCPSVATHPDNYVELCWQHHSEFDSSFEKAAKMGVFVEAKRKFNLFKHLMPNSELRKVNPYLLETNSFKPSSPIDRK